MIKNKYYEDLSSKRREEIEKPDDKNIYYEDLSSKRREEIENLMIKTNIMKIYHQKGEKKRYTCPLP